MLVVLSVHLLLTKITFTSFIPVLFCFFKYLGICFPIQTVLFDKFKLKHSEYVFLKQKNQYRNMQNTMYNTPGLIYSHMQHFKQSRPGRTGFHVAEQGEKRGEIS